MLPMHAGSGLHCPVLFQRSIRHAHMAVISPTRSRTTPQCDCAGARLAWLVLMLEVSIESRSESRIGSLATERSDARAALLKRLPPRAAAAGSRRGATAAGDGEDPPPVTHFSSQRFRHLSTFGSPLSAASASSSAARCCSLEKSGIMNAGWLASMPPPASDAVVFPAL